MGPGIAQAHATGWFLKLVGSFNLTKAIEDPEFIEARPVRDCVERNHDMKNFATRNANNE